MLQLIPVPVGSESLNVAAVAPPAPVLLNVRVYPIEDPADTVAESAASVRLSDGHCTVVVADAWTELPFAALAVALLAYTAQLDPPVPLVTCTEAVAPPARLPKLQLNVWLAREHVPGPL